MQHVLLTSLFIALSIVCEAQTLKFCSSFTPEGIAADAANAWTIKPAGGYINVVYHNEGKNINSPLLTFQVKKENHAGVITEVETVPVVPDKSKKFAFVDYKFVTPGEYIFEVRDKDKVLASEKVSIRMHSGSVTGTAPIDTYYYSASALSSGINFDPGTGKFEKKISSFVVDKTTGGFVTFKMNANKPINSDKLIVEVYKLQDTNSEYVETKEFSISNINWYWASFNLTFHDAGQYQVKTYNGSGVWMNDCFITVTNK